MGERFDGPWLRNVIKNQGGREGGSREDGKTYGDKEKCIKHEQHDRQRRKKERRERKKKLETSLDTDEGVGDTRGKNATVHYTCNCFIILETFQMPR